MNSRSVWAEALVAVKRHGAEIAFPTQPLPLLQPLVGPPGEALAKARRRVTGATG